MHTVEILNNADKTNYKKAEVISQVKSIVSDEVYKELEHVLPSIIEVAIYISRNKKTIKLNRKCCF